MIDHLSFYATDYDTSRAFYQPILEALGYGIQSELIADWNSDFPTQRMCAFGPDGIPTFWLIESKIAYTPRHLAFSAHTRESVDSFYQEGIKNGGIDNGEPGLRPMYHDNYYAAFLLDPDGNNVEAVCHVEER